MTNMETNDLDYFKQKIYEISGVPKSRLEKDGSMENIAKRNKKAVDELFGEDPSKTFIIRVGNFRFRFLYDPCILIDGWVSISFHFSYTLKHTLNFHMSVRKKWPFIKIGFRNIYPKLYKGEGF